MKRLILFLVIFAAGCTTPSLTPRETVYFGFDFTKYTEEGFLITPESYNGNYESVGLLNATIIPAIIENDSKYSYYKYVSEKVNLAEAIDSLVFKAKEMGADAIINFSTEITQGEIKGIPANLISASGFAIKRK